MKKLLVATAAFQIALSGYVSAAEPIELKGTQGRFDFIKIDEGKNRLLACHTGNNSLDVIDINASKFVKSIPTGAAQGVAIDEKHGLYFVSTSKPAKLVIIDSAKLEVVGEVALPFKADLVAYHEGSNRVFVCNDEKPELWIIDPAAKKIVKTLTFQGEGMEDVVFDASSKYLFQALKDADQVARVDVTNYNILNIWPTAPSVNPHGMALAPENGGGLLVAGGTGKLSLLNPSSGTVLCSVDIALKVDEIAYDIGLHTVYCASGTGDVSVVEVADGKLTTKPSLKGAQGAHSIAVDSKSHGVWIAYAKGQDCFVQQIN